jgi:hypothetical protein
MEMKDEDTTHDEEKTAVILLQLLAAVKFDVYTRNSNIIRSLYDMEVRMQLLSISKETIETLFQIRGLFEDSKHDDILTTLFNIFYEFNSSIGADTVLENMVATYVCSNILNDFCDLGIRVFRNLSFDELELNKDLVNYNKMLIEYVKKNFAKNATALDTLSMWARKLISDTTFLFHELSRHISNLGALMSEQKWVENELNHHNSNDNKSNVYSLYDYLMENHSLRSKEIGFKI